MIKQSQNVITTANFNEIGSHGSPDFPVAAYDSDCTHREVIWHWHREFEIIHVTEGSLAVLIPNRKLILQKNDVVFINSEVLHSSANASDGNCLFHTAVFLPELLCSGEIGIFWKKYIHPLICSQELPCTLMTSEHASHLMLRFWEENVKEQNGYEFQVRSILTDLILMVIQGQTGQEAALNPRKHRDEERIRQMLSYIHSNYTEELTIPAIASQASISESECLRCFKNCLGTTPVQYIRRYRLEMAAHDLTVSAKSITEIATSCGFNHMSYFSKIFQEAYGMLPREFRQQRRLP